VICELQDCLNVKVYMEEDKLKVRQHSTALHREGQGDASVCFESAVSQSV
jgi:hypothetical protein